MQPKPLLRAFLIIGLLATLILFLAASTRASTTYTVSRTDDPSPDSCLPGDCSLREAIRAANAAPGVDLIVLPVGTYMLSLTPTKTDINAANGDLNITDSLTIQGTGAASTIIDGNQLDAVLSIWPGINVTLNNVTIQNGRGKLGGAILSGGNLTLNNTTVRNSTSLYGPGGGIYQHNGGVLTLNNSTVSGNNAPADAGGIYNLGVVRLNHSTVSGNRSQGGGGGLANHGGTVYVINSTISGNRTDFNGGGIFNWNNGRVELFNATLANNVVDNDHNNSGSGGGIHTALGAVVVMRNSLIGNNSNREALFSYTRDDCAGFLNSGGYNLIEATTGCIISGLNTGNKTGLDPDLGPLANEGGPTQTHALQSGSPAIDAGNPGGCADGLGALLSTDQRGYIRPASGRCDIGAFEFGATIPTPVPMPIPSPSPLPPGPPILQQLYLPLIIK